MRTESNKIDRFDPDNFIEFRTDAVRYRSMNDIINDRNLWNQLSPQGQRWVRQQHHSAVKNEIPMNSIVNIVINGVRRTDLLGG